MGLNWYSFKWRNYDPAIGRFMCIDPLAEKYVYNSVYNFSENRVIDGRELEGLEWSSIKNENGTYDRTLKVQLYNNANLSEKQIEKFKEETQEEFAKVYSADGGTAKLIFEEGPENSEDAQFAVTLVNRKVEELTTEGGKVTKKFIGGQAHSLADSQKNKFEVVAKVNNKLEEYKQIARSFAHEAGHTLGLRHPWDPRNKISDIKQNSPNVTDKTIKRNLMNSSANIKIELRTNSGTELTPGQFEVINETIHSQQ